jgi:DNA-binding NtrC family response regulator
MASILVIDDNETMRLGIKTSALYYKLEKYGIG